MKLFDSLLKHRKRKAFTLVEVLIVVAILGILFIALMASVNWSTDTARETGVQTDMRAYQTACNAVGLEGAGFPDDLKTLAQMLNKRLDPNLEVKVSDGKLMTDRRDPWGVEYRIGYNRPSNSKGQLTFTSAGPDSIFDNFDDIITVIRYEVIAGGGGNVVVENPKNEEFHTHAYDKRVEDTKYLYKKATCVSIAQYYYSCACGAMGTEIFETGHVDAYAHGETEIKYSTSNLDTHIIDTSCKLCGASIEAKSEPHTSSVSGNTTSCTKCGQVLHTHNYDQTNTNNKYIKIEATCQSRAVYYYSCSCGEAGSETFESGSAKAHNYSAQLPDNKYLHSGATCVAEATYYKSCVYCGAVGSTTFTSGGFKADNHVGGTTLEYTNKNGAVHLKTTLCMSCNGAVHSEEEAHVMSNLNTCMFCNEHTHDFSIQSATDKYLKLAATCTEPAVFYKSCRCGEAGSDTFVFGNLIDHDFSRKMSTSEYLISAATCSSEAVYQYSCSACGKASSEVYTYGGVDIRNHSPENDRTLRYESIDSSLHFKQSLCNYCNKTVDSVTEPHTMSGSICIYCPTHRHNFAGTELTHLAAEATCITKALYYHTCTVTGCDEVGSTTFEYGNYKTHDYTAQIASSTYISTYATCTNAAQYYYSCTMCGKADVQTFTYGQKDLSNHVNKNPSLVSTESACYKYLCCDTLVKEHNIVKGREIAPTCTDNGSIAYACTNCLYAYTESVPAVGHISNNDATCTTRDTCQICKQEIGDAPIGHNITQPASCVLAAWCSRCQKRVGEPAGHVRNIPSATCTQSVTCTVCNDLIEGALNHDPSGPAATCNSPKLCARGCGYELEPKLEHYLSGSATCEFAQKCHLCGWVAQEALGHNYDESKTTCTNAAYCLRCGKIYTGTDPKYLAQGHIEITDAYVAPTCLTSGLTEGKHCGRAGCTSFVLAQEIIPALGHATAELPYVAPTCTTDGLTAGSYCTRCSEILLAQQTIGQLGHAFPVRTICTDVLVCTRDGCLATESSEHIWVDATCTEQKYCNKCGFKEGLALSHHMVPASCEEPSHCDREGCSYVEGNSLGHILSSQGVEYIAPTCTTKGWTEGRFCTRCYVTFVEQEEIQAYGHWYTVGYEWSCHSDTANKYEDTETCKATAVCVRCTDQFVLTGTASNILDRPQTCTDTQLWHHAIDWLNVNSGTAEQRAIVSQDLEGSCRQIHNYGTVKDHVLVANFTIVEGSENNCILSILGKINCVNCAYSYQEYGNIIYHPTKDATCSTPNQYISKISFSYAFLQKEYESKYDAKMIIGKSEITVCPCYASTLKEHKGTNMRAHAYLVDPNWIADPNGNMALQHKYCEVTFTCKYPDCKHSWKETFNTDDHGEMEILGGIQDCEKNDIRRARIDLSGIPYVSAQSIYCCDKSGHLVATAAGHNYNKDDIVCVWGCDTYQYLDNISVTLTIKCISCKKVATTTANATPLNGYGQVTSAKISCANMGTTFVYNMPAFVWDANGTKINVETRNCGHTNHMQFREHNASATTTEIRQVDYNQDPTSYDSNQYHVTITKCVTAGCRDGNVASKKFESHIAPFPEYWYIIPEPPDKWLDSWKNVITGKAGKFYDNCKEWVNSTNWEDDGVTYNVKELLQQYAPHILNFYLENKSLENELEDWQAFQNWYDLGSAWRAEFHTERYTRCYLCTRWVDTHSATMTYPSYDTMPDVFSGEDAFKSWILEDNPNW